MVRVFSSGEQKQSAPSESCHRLSCRLLSHASSHLFTVMLDESNDSSNMSCYFELDAQVAEKDFSGRISLQYFPYKNLLSSSNSSVSFLRTECFTGNTLVWSGENTVVRTGKNSSALNRAGKLFPFVH